MKHYKLNKIKFAKFILVSIVLINCILVGSMYLDICCNNLDTNVGTYWFPWTHAFAGYVASLS